MSIVILVVSFQGLDGRGKLVESLSSLPLAAFIMSRLSYVHQAGNTSFSRLMRWERGTSTNNYRTIGRGC